MRKAMTLILTAIMILLISACNQTAVQETTEKETIATTPPEATLPRITLPEITLPEITPVLSATPTPDNFDVEDVIMQSTPGSSCFSEIGYDSYGETLVVRFRDSGAVYTYLDFPADEWDKFSSADSLGSWFNKYIKGQYECERIR